MFGKRPNQITRKNIDCYKFACRFIECIQIIGAHQSRFHCPVDKDVTGYKLVVVEVVAGSLLAAVRAVLFRRTNSSAYSCCCREFVAIEMVAAYLFDVLALLVIVMGVAVVAAAPAVAVAAVAVVVMLAAVVVVAAADAAGPLINLNLVR